ncbi:MAG: glycosyltransferase, partial [Anaerolineae bacterium]|nr:glycosyltransferase [Anaerolineae bacterium]
MPSPSLGWLLGCALFWLALIGIGYTYLGYGALIAALARLWPRPVRRAEIAPTVTALIAAYNEEACIAAKLDNTLALDYPPDQLAVIVVADGSTDRTCDIVASYPSLQVRLLYEPERRGKVGALLRALPFI